MGNNSKTRFLALLLGVAPVSGGLTSCSLVIESRDRQCEKDADCASFSNAVCDVAGGVCVPRSTGTGGGGTGGAGGGCVGPDGCFSCPPEKPVEFLNACTDVLCVPYDNTQLQGLLQEDGSVPPVP